MQPRKQLRTPQLHRRPRFCTTKLTNRPSVHPFLGGSEWQRSSFPQFRDFPQLSPQSEPPSWTTRGLNALRYSRTANCINGPQRAAPAINGTGKHLCTSRGPLDISLPKKWGDPREGGGFQAFKPSSPI